MQWRLEKSVKNVSQQFVSLESNPQNCVVNPRTRIPLTQSPVRDLLGKNQECVNLGLLCTVLSQRIKQGNSWVSSILTISLGKIEVLLLGNPPQRHTPLRFSRTRVGDRLFRCRYLIGFENLL